MGQEEVLQVLEKNEKPLTSREIANALEDNIFHVCKILSDLVEIGEIKFKIITDAELKKKQGTTRSFRIYFIQETKGNKKLR